MAETSCRVNIRLYHDKSNMRTFKKFVIEEFPIFNEVIQAKMCLLDQYQNEFNHRLSLETLELGYVGYSNTKHKITTDSELKQGFDSKTNHKDNCAVFYLAERPATASASSLKRKASCINVGEYHLLA